MSDLINLRARGLVTNPSDLLNVPEGALSVADNVVIDRENLVSPRRGLKEHSAISATGTDRVNKLFSYQDKLLASFTGNKLAYYNSSSWTNYSTTHAAITGEKIRSTESNSNFYFTTSSGVQKLDAFNGTPRLTGSPRALDGAATLTGASGFMDNDSQVAYRIVWGYRDQNDNLILGAPSQRITIANSAGGTRDVSLTFTVPASVDTTWFYQIYRSALSATATTEPNDELGLVFEGNPSGAQITAKSITLTDSTPSSLRGAALYTNDSQEGILQANNQPPLATDVATFRNHVFYANTTSKHRLFVDLLAVGGTGGLAATNTVTVAGTTYTGAAAEDVAANEFLVETGGTPAQNIKDTALSLIRVINKSSSNTSVYAYYLSGPDDLPGKILIEERGLGGSAFTAQVSANGAAWNPNLTSAQSSTNDRKRNGLYFSKTLEPEAVPLVNFRNVGSAQSPILRIAALRDSLFIFKSEGIYRLTGETPDTFVVDLFDASTRLLAPESLQVLNNQIYCFTDQGIVSVSEVGVEVKSRAIEKTLLELYGANQSVMEAQSFGVSYESDRKYIFSTVSSSIDTGPNQMFVYNVFTDSWTRWDLSKAAGIVLSNRLYFADSGSNKIKIERKDASFTDFTDEAVAVTISSSTGTLVTLTSTADIEVGDILYQTSTKYSPVVEIIDTMVVRVVDEIAWSAAAAEVLKAFEVLVEWWPITGGNPGLLKQFQEVTMLFDVAYFVDASMRFYSEQSSAIETVTIEGNYGSLWGLFAWGGIPWGGDSFKSIPIRTLIPRNKQRCSQLSLQFRSKSGYGQFSLQGTTIKTRPVSARIGR